MKNPTSIMFFAHLIPYASSGINSNPDSSDGRAHQQLCYKSFPSKYNIFSISGKDYFSYAASRLNKDFVSGET